MHIANTCPNLEQFGAAFEGYTPENLRVLVAALPKLRVLRVLIPPEGDMWRTMRTIDVRLHELAISREFGQDDLSHLKVLGIGGFVALLGGITETRAGKRRIVKSVSWEDAKHIDIFGLDSTDII
jgi:hypothetical protein